MADLDALTPEEQAFFASGGEQKPQELPAEPTPPKPHGAEAAAEQQPDDQGAPGRDEKGRFVPHGALHAEREERKRFQAEAEASRRELNELRERQARFEERFRMAQEATRPKPEEQGPPDPNVDIFASLKWQQDQLVNMQRAQAEARQRDQEQQQAQSQETQLWNAWQAEARDYGAVNPDFAPAAQWLAQARDKQLQALAYANPQYANPAVRNAQMDNELRDIIVSAVQQGRRPAEVVYEVARGYGYQTPAPKPIDPPANGQQDDKFKRIDAAQKASRTIGQVSGNSGGDAITPDAIARMSEKEFAAFISDKSNAKLFERMMSAA